ncbi:DUF2537 domain-containing protein [Williamsia phyllosphaerae]|uniref:DUF2537 domain-containing protein n=1 Tax=Williamsia phyllosphaerae TaxID=885042 RepID=A0ABQ1V4J8_9NOCA|nr:DUF2537 domain-containing protein [Williamsia phyllosphaerae]GGF36212.1 hypothetical protein GCM10007298_35050 [Williamsia phyllosphaerae]
MAYDAEDLPDPDEPTPWTLGVLLASLSAVFTTCVSIGVYDVVAQTHILLGVAAVLVVCGGVAPTAWIWRRRSVLRWPSWGAIIGLAVGVPVTVFLAAAGIG